MSESLQKSEEIVVNRVTVEEVKERMSRGEQLVFVDSRSEESRGKSDVQIPGSIRVPPDDAAANVDRVPKDRSVVTYCT